MTLVLWKENLFLRVGEELKVSQEWRVILLWWGVTLQFWGTDRKKKRQANKLREFRAVANVQKNWSLTSQWIDCVHTHWATRSAPMHALHTLWVARYEVSNFATTYASCVSLRTLHQELAKVDGLIIANVIYYQHKHTHTHRVIETETGNCRNIGRRKDTTNLPRLSKV